MAAKNKTIYTEVTVEDFIESYVDKDSRKEDSYRLIELMRKWTGHEPKMWGPTIVGFGNYHYKYASGHEGDAPMLGFSPRKGEFSLYIVAPGHTSEKLLDQLGKYTMGKACIYFKKLDDLNLKTLEKISKDSIKYLKENHQCS